jgi:hypothetical protein
VPLTTIKVPVELRDRIATDAREQGKTLAAFLVTVVEEWEHRQRMAAVGQAFASGLDEDYRAELAAWDAITASLPRE